MSENTSLGDIIAGAVNDYLAENGGGFPVAFVMGLDYVNEEGKSFLRVCEMGDQPTYRSMGLSSYLEAWYRDDAERGWLVAESED